MDSSRCRRQVICNAHLVSHLCKSHHHLDSMLCLIQIPKLQRDHGLFILYKSFKKRYVEAAALLLFS